ncbi:MAG: helix-turn-helix domain-containing protein [Anaerolineae bacterium]|nr:helix-turn-helix domain-containing protein [Anaerolineae bacterium]
MIQEVAGYDPGQRRTEIGRRIREARIQHHLTQTEVAEILGCSRIKLNRVENGKADLTALELDLLAYAFQLPVAFFFSTEGGLVQRIVWSSEPERGLVK